MFTQPLCIALISYGQFHELRRGFNIELLLSAFILGYQNSGSVMGLDFRRVLLQVSEVFAGPNIGNAVPFPAGEAGDFTPLCSLFDLGI